jgi:hypothetical protein
MTPEPVCCWLPRKAVPLFSPRGPQRSSNLHHGGLHLGGDMCEIPTQGPQLLLGRERVGRRGQDQQRTEPRQRGEMQVSAPHWPARPRPVRR